MIELSRSIPLTLLLKVLDAEAVSRGGEPLKDCISVLRYLKDTTDDAVLIEKAVAAKAFQLNRSSLWDAHGFANLCLIMNSIPASVDYIPAVDPCFINYAVWELSEYDPSILIGPESRRFVSASLKTFDYPYPPDELSSFEDEFLQIYKSDAVLIRDAYQYIAPAYFAGNVKDSADLDNLVYTANEKYADGDGDKLTYVGFHVTRLLAADQYLKDMQHVYKTWADKIGAK